jgi:glycosyltransferase involved in cell wall biosynthesis
MQDLKALLVSANYPNEYYLWTPWNKMANFAISKLDNVKTEIIAPLPFSLPFKFFPYHKLYNISSIEYCEEGNVHRPRFFYMLPQRFFYGETGQFYKKSISKYILKNLKDVDIIHTHQAYPDGYGIVDLSKSLSIPYITEIHSTNTLNIWSNHRSVNKKFLKTLNSSDKIVCISEELCNSVINLGIEEEKISHIPLGVDIDRFRPRNVENIKFKLGISDEKVLLFVGRLVKLKNVDHILKAVLKVVNFYKNFKLLIVGDGPEKDNLLRLSKRLKLDKYVMFLGELKGTELSCIYSLADILVLASSTEGRPIVIYEAMASECSIIATNVGGIPEQVKDGYNGLLIEPENPSMLADKIGYMLENEELMVKMGKNSRKHIIKENWTWNGYAERIKKIYIDTVG